MRLSQSDLIAGINELCSVLCPDFAYDAGHKPSESDVHALLAELEAIHD